MSHSLLTNCQRGVRQFAPEPPARRGRSFRSRARRAALRIGGPQMSHTCGTLCAQSVRRLPVTHLPGADRHAVFGWERLFFSLRTLGAVMGRGFALDGSRPQRCTLREWSCTESTDQPDWPGACSDWRWIGSNHSAIRPIDPKRRAGVFASVERARVHIPPRA